MPSAYTIKDIEPRIDHMGNPVWFSRSSGVAYKRANDNDELGAVLHDDLGKAGGLPEQKVLAPAAAAPTDLLSSGKEVPANHAPMRKFADLPVPQAPVSAAESKAKVEPPKRRKRISEMSIDEFDNPYEASFTPAE